MQARVPGITILRPLKGIDAGLYECLRSSFAQSYPCEILLCVADASDPAIAVAQQLIDEFPQADARVLVGAESYGPNPKINNLTKGYKAAKFDLVWACDSNVAAPPHAAAEAVDAMLRHPKVQLAHNVPIAVACNDAGLGAELEQMYLSTAHAKFYTGINVVNIAPCVCGKSNFYRRSDLDLAAEAEHPGEGLQFFANFIAEDQMIAERLWDRGGRTALLAEPVAQPLAGWPSAPGSHSTGASAFAGRRMRWIRIRKFLCLSATMVEPLTECLASGVIGTTAICYLFGIPFGKWLIVHCCGWFALDYTQFRMLQRTAAAKALRPATSTFSAAAAKNGSHEGGARTSIWAFSQAWVIRELLCLPIWLYAMAGTRIEWRERVFRLRSDKSAYEITASTDC